MRRIVVFGNSGSGKSTLAKALSNAEGLSHFDLDSIAWLPTTPPERMPLEKSEEHIASFTSAHAEWVIEGCYGDLIEIAVKDANEMIFLNLSVDQCIDNARMRPWEPHKYQTEEAQNENLDMLIEWIKAYPHRDDCCSLAAHAALFQKFEGKKTMATSNTTFR